MKKIYLVNIPIIKTDNREIQSLGMAYLTADLQHNGFDVMMIDGCGIHANTKIEDIKNEILQNRPDYIGFYVIEFNLSSTLDLICELKKIYPFVAFLGGPQASLLGEEIIQHNPYVDFVTCGEMDTKLSAILNGDRNVNGLIYRENGRIIKNSVACENINLDSLYFPIRKIDNKIFLTKEEINGEILYSVPVSSSRGCPFNCAFCSVPAMIKEQKVKWRFRSAENIIDEIREIYLSYKKIVVRFIDDNFLVDIPRAQQITSELHQMGNIPFSFSARVDAILKIDENILKQLKNDGLLTIEIGIENFCDSVLSRYRKGHTGLQAIQAIDKLRKCGILPSIDFIMFDPWTTVEELSYNMQILKQEQLTMYYEPFIYHRLYPFPGTAYYKKIDMAHYFNDKKVEKIYNKLSEFKNTFGSIIDSIIQNHTFGIQKITCLKAPYKLFEALIENPDLDLKESQIIKSIVGMSKTHT